MKYDKNAHSIFLLHFHLILVVKYRRKVIDDEISNALKSIFSNIGLKYGIYIEEWNHDIDHIHILFRGTTKADFCSFIDSSNHVHRELSKKNFLKLKRNYGNHFFGLLHTV